MKQKKNTAPSTRIKPFYKKWWFWLVVILLTIIIGTSNSKGNTSSAQPVQEEQQISEHNSTESPEKLTGKDAILPAVISVIGEENLETFNYAPENNFSLIKFKGSENLTSNMTIKGMYLDIFNILKNIQSTIDTDVDFNVVYPLQDTSGNITDTIVIKATFTNNTIKDINFETAIFENIPNMADEWWNHNAVSISE